MSAIPVVYRNQTNAWVDSNIFVERSENIFVPKGKEHQLKNDHRETTLLLIDNARYS